MNTDEKTQDQIRIETGQIQSFKIEADDSPFGLIEMYGVSVANTEYDTVFIGRGQSELLAAEDALEQLACSSMADDDYGQNQIEAAIGDLDDCESACGAVADARWREFQKANGCPAAMVDQGKFVCPEGTTPSEFGLKFKAELESADLIEMSAAILIRFGYPDTKEAALARHLEIPADDVTAESYGDNNYSAGGLGDYLILDDGEADIAATENVKESLWTFNGWFLADHMPGEITADDVDLMRGDRCEGANDMLKALVEATPNGMDDFVGDAIGADGRGHFLAGYDGDEIEILGPDGEMFFAYRTN